MANTAARLARYHETEPSRVRAGTRGSNDLYCLATLKRLTQRAEIAINATSNRGVTYVCVDSISKVHWCCAPGQLHNFTPRGEHIDLIREEIHFYVFNKLERVVRALAHFHQALNPAVHSRLVDARSAGRLVFIHPVGRNTIVGNVFHFLGTNLDFDIYVHTEKSGVQRLVTIGLGHSNIVFKPARHWLIKAVNSAKNPVTVVFGI